MNITIQKVSLAWGIIAVMAMIIGLFPCFGMFNWINIPFSGVGLIIGILSFISSIGKSKIGPVIGIVLCIIAMLVGIIRLFIGFGVI